MTEKSREITAGENPLEVLLNVHMQLHERIFSSTNILLVITTFIFSLTTGFFLNKFVALTILMKMGVVILILSSLSTLVLCLLISRPELKHKKAETEFYYMDVFSRYNKKQYEKRMYQILKGDETTLKFFTDEFYTLGSKVLLPNFKKIKLATEVLITGVILSVILFALSFIFPTL